MGLGLQEAAQAVYQDRVLCMYRSIGAMWEQQKVVLHPHQPQTEGPYVAHAPRAPHTGMLEPDRWRSHGMLCLRAASRCPGS